MPMQTQLVYQYPIENTMPLQFNCNTAMQEQPQFQQQAQPQFAQNIER